MSDARPPLEEASHSQPNDVDNLFQRRNIVGRSAGIATRELTVSWRTVWRCCLVLIAVGTSYPWIDFQGYAHWERVRWVPFQNMRPWPSIDVLANIACIFLSDFRTCSRGYMQPRIRKGCLMGRALIREL